eukprot:6686220-Ditylum_brightwellii.AAC.1
MVVMAMEAQERVLAGSSPSEGRSSRVHTCVQVMKHRIYQVQFLHSPKKGIVRYENVLHTWTDIKLEK